MRNGPLESMWFTVYWLTALMTYAVVPVVQEYEAAGGFTPRARCIASVQINMTFYAAVGALGFFALAYVVLIEGLTLDALLPVLVSLANTSGLLIIVLLLGFGAAEVPRELWRASSPRDELRTLYFSAAEAEGNVFDARQALGDILSALEKFKAKLTAMQADKAFEGDGAMRAKMAAMAKGVAVVEAKAKPAAELLGPAFLATAASRAAASSRAAAREALQPEEDEDEKGFLGGFTGLFKGKDARYKGVSMAKLAATHKALMAQVAAVQKALFRWESAVLRAMELEYILARVVPPVPVKKSTVDGATVFYVTPKAPPPAKGAPARSPMLALASGLATPPGIDDKAFDVLSDAAGRHLLRLMCFPGVARGALNRAAWHAKIFWAPVIFKVLSVLADVLSLILIWCEATIWLNLTGLVPTNLSVFGQMLIAIDSSTNDNSTYFWTLVASALPLAYMCLLSMYTVFKLKIFNMLDLAGHQNTDAYSLLVNVRGRGALPPLRRPMQRASPAPSPRRHRS